VVGTDDVSKDGKIEKCVKCGFRDTESGKSLRQAEVNIYKINNNK
jgi:Zn ribbon nucleic-acid-binding protein